MACQFKACQAVMYGHGRHVTRIKKISRAGCAMAGLHL
ncbi:hypothetical protein OF001_U100069 [Pseudomonas sp. OF001]|nr:hypothetical protein OF001_U100069 [Pseudomonas sp. OF001]